MFLFPFLELACLGGDTDLLVNGFFVKGANEADVSAHRLVGILWLLALFVREPRFRSELIEERFREPVD